MMKPLHISFGLMLMFLFGINTSLFAQDFAPIGAQWYYANTFGVEWTNKAHLISIITSERDTTVQGKQGRVLVQRFYKDKNVLSKDPFHQYVIYEDSGRVYNWRNGKFQLLYDWNRKVGDFYPWYGITREIARIDTVTLGGRKLRRFYLPVRSGSDTVFYLPFAIENIGDLFAFDPYGEQPRFSGMRCYMDSSIDFHADTTVQTCDSFFISTGLAENEAPAHRFAVYPNPVSETLTIKAEKFSSESLNICLTNTLGQIVIQKKVRLPLQLDLHSLPGGMYFLHIGASDPREKTTLKILKY